MVFAGLADAEKSQVLFQAFCRTRPGNNISQFGKGLYRMLGIIVIPRNVIKPQEGEGFVAVLIKPLHTLHRYIGLLTIIAAATELGVSRMTVWRMIHDGRLLTVETRLGRRRVPSEEITRILRPVTAKKRT